jgi:hypothetical protein
VKQMKIIGEMRALSLIYRFVLYVGAVGYVISLLFTFLCYFIITRLVFSYSFHVCFLVQHKPTK